jgi:uncharacterized protein YprB with RNaseH-like and TPR domain
MLQHTFCHLNNIGPRKERAFWANNIVTWQDLSGYISGSDSGRTAYVSCNSKKPPRRLAAELAASVRHLVDGNAAYFGGKLKSADAWRLFADFRHGAAYIDIETTGLQDPEITTIALYDGNRIRYYVNGQNLDQFPDDIMKYPLLVTFNGKTFDVPIIERFFKTKLDQAHIDLRYVLKSLGFSGGLKSCEKQLGIFRGGLDGVDGYFAVLLWEAWCQTGNIKALETLLAYNIEDVLNLEKLMVMAFNRKIRDLPLPAIKLLPLPTPPASPFVPNPEIIEQIKYASRFRRF